MHGLNVAQTVDRLREMAWTDVGDASLEFCEGAIAILRWSSTDGSPVCPHCGNYAHGVRNIKMDSGRKRKVFKCRGCKKQYFDLSKTPFACAKTPTKKLLGIVLAYRDKVDPVEIVSHTYKDARKRLKVEAEKIEILMYDVPRVFDMPRISRSRAKELTHLRKDLAAFLLKHGARYRVSFMILRFSEYDPKAVKSAYADMANMSRARWVLVANGRDPYPGVEELERTREKIHQEKMETVRATGPVPERSYYDELDSF